MFYTPHLSREEVQQGIADKTLFESTLRINQRRYEEGFVDNPEGEEEADILIYGLHDRNRALQGDVVIFRIKERCDWAVVEDHNLPDSLLQKTAEVVGIKEKKHSRIAAGTIKPLGDGSRKWVLFSPSDSRVPRMMVAADQAPKGFFNRPQDFSKFLYVAHMLEWPCTSLFAPGLVIYGHYSHFLQEDLKCRRDFRREVVFTIDPLTARDLDDALHIRAIEDCDGAGRPGWEVGVHIADVSHFVKPGTEVDMWASRRATSVYLVDRVIPMLPRALCEDLCSLLPGVERLTVSVVWNMDDEGNIYDEWFGKSVIRSCCKLAYEHVQVRILAIFLGNRRSKQGSLRIEQPKLCFDLTDKGTPRGVSIYERKQAHSLVEEFMLLANAAVARKIEGYFPDRALLRRHPPPRAYVFRNVLEKCKLMGFNVDGSSSSSLASSLREYSTRDKYNHQMIQVLSNLLLKSMRLAEYFCTGTVMDKSKYAHYALAAPYYTHFTSPIRRYPDIMVHRFLSAALGSEPDPPWNIKEISDIASYCNTKKLAAKTVSEIHAEMYFGLYVKACGPLVEKAVVLQVLDAAFDVLIIRYGLFKRVYVNVSDNNIKIIDKRDVYFRSFQIYFLFIFLSILTLFRNGWGTMSRCRDLSV
ncbi:unnamed protein product [Enterobius vermicularis]|uniref:RNB domain-containing protein n=1 Tax=Enterobius vermicularis TaxID=51028 RepID=A0A0N4VF63_ENTVE|nr:unnamed protein product [Enterobius vermicularis]